ncbi:hypothetical protein FB451DRAFT_1414473 [Mycena latifolia]|nr:hypothetical protein FB451DRAFT_1414473 [Mycena latifolia]
MDPEQSTCSRCVNVRPTYRCRDCLHAGWQCGPCITSVHAEYPLHRIQGAHWAQASLKSLGLRLQLRHDAGQVCPHARRKDDFVVITAQAVEQLMEAQLMPATENDPEVAATFEPMNSSCNYGASKAATRVRKKRRHSASPPRVPTTVSCAPQVPPSVARHRLRRYSELAGSDSEKNINTYVESDWEAGWQKAMEDINAIWTAGAAEETREEEEHIRRVYEGQTDGEGPERRWANANPLAGSDFEQADRQWASVLHITTSMMREPDRQRMLLEECQEERLESLRAHRRAAERRAARVQQMMLDERREEHDLSRRLAWNHLQGRTREMGPSPDVVLILTNDLSWPMSKRKKPTDRIVGTSTISTNRDDTPATQARQTEPAVTNRLLREKTRIRLDGSIQQARAVVNVPAGEDHRPSAKLRPDVPREHEPIYDAYDAGQDGDVDSDDEEGRRLRESDDPLRQWAEDHLPTFLLELLRWEGRGDHRNYPSCTACKKGSSADHRCIDCFSGGHLCAVAVSSTDISVFLSTELSNGTGHWHGPDRRCSVPLPATNDDFVVVDNQGVHQVGLDYCGCGQGGPETIQLLRAGLFPATTTNPRTAATFAVLHRYHLLSFESKCSGYEFYQSLARETDNMKHKPNKDRYHEFLRMTREWRHVVMLKRAGRGHVPDGIATTPQGSCALLCPACPQPGKNLPPGWKDVPEEKQFLYALFLAIDANFRLKRKDVSTEEKDPGLGKGWAFYCEVEAYMKHVAENWHQKQERSHCVAHDAVDKPDREARGTASSGIGAVDCARHNMKRPTAVGDLQLGERSITGTELMRFFVSYDIACQWHINIWTRMLQYKNDDITLDGAGRFVTFLVPKFHLPAHIEACNLRFSFNLTRDKYKGDGPRIEARHVRRPFHDLNHKKIIAPEAQTAVPEMVKTERALADLEESLGPTVVKEWTDMAVKWRRIRTLLTILDACAKGRPLGESA